MRWTNDDSFLTGECVGEEFYVPDYPADIEVMGYFQDPLLSAELDMMIDEADLMGIDLDDPELMGAWLKNLIGKIKSRIQKRKAAKAAGGAEPGTMPTIAVQTPKGTASIGPGGIQWTDPAAAAAAVPSAYQATGGIGEMLKNPWVIGGGAAALLLIIMMMKKKRG